MYRNFCADNSNKSQLGESANRQEIRFSAMNFNKFLGFGPYQGTEAKKSKNDRLTERKAFDFPAVREVR